MGNYTEYRTRKRPIVLDIPAPLKSNAKSAPIESKPAPAVAKPAQKKSAKVKVRTIEDVERDIEKAEERVKALEGELSEAALRGDAAQLMQLSAGYEQAKARVDELLIEWEQLGTLP
jgi:hypothetical protein